MLDFLERSLRRRFEVRRAGSAADALRLLEDDEFDVLITDQKMPKMGGLELLERIGDSHPELVRLLLSGFAEMPEIRRARLDCRIHNYIFKPIDSRTLLEAIDEAIAVARATDEPAD